MHHVLSVHPDVACHAWSWGDAGRRWRELSHTKVGPQMDRDPSVENVQSKGPMAICIGSPQKCIRLQRDVDRCQSHCGNRRQLAINTHHEPVVLIAKMGI